ncbi:hypothetical protein [Streptomyces niger]|uniref:hypothetical protein n=1 Tax=Streptomyces niger TaxID=66373 RepID=UPI000AE14FBC|nr:hypothetical protein [Streptomyces niger]
MTDDAPPASRTRRQRLRARLASDARRLEAFLERLSGRRRGTGTGPDEAAGPAATARSGRFIELANTALGASSFFLALMLYAGLMHNASYYGYFHIDTFTVGFDALELAVTSLRLMTLPVLTTLALVAFLPRVPEFLTSLGVPAVVLRILQRAGAVIARGHLFVVAFGITLLFLWPHLAPHTWIAPLVVLCGLILGQTGAVPPGPRAGHPVRYRAIPLAVAGIFGMWLIALVAGHLGQTDAEADAAGVARRVPVVVFSTELLSMTGPPGLDAPVDLGKNKHYRYRYTGLRLLVERHDRYYLIPMGFDRDTDPTYVIEDDDSIRIELHPGVSEGGAP